MSTIVIREFSSGADGVPIKIAATATAGTAIHTATSETADGSYDRVWLWAYNSHTADVQLTVEFGGATDPDNHIVKTIPFDQGVWLVVPGLILQNSKTVKAFAAIANVIVVSGYVERITD